MGMQESLGVDAVKKLIGKSKFAGKRDGSRYGKRHVPSQMNATESAFAEWCESRKICGEIVEWRFESHDFMITPSLRYKSDFELIFPDGTKEFVDTKVAVKDRVSINKIKCCADKFWEYTFVIYERLPKKAGWKRIEF